MHDKTIPTRQDENWDLYTNTCRINTIHVAQLNKLNVWTEINRNKNLSKYMDFISIYNIMRYLTSIMIKMKKNKQLKMNNKLASIFNYCKLYHSHNLIQFRGSLTQTFIVNFRNRFKIIFSCSEN